MLVIGHRGAIEQNLENSWSAFEQAIKLGLSRIEFDVHLARDGALCIMHDDDLARTSSGSGKIHELGREEIARHPLKNGEKIPFLDEVFARMLPHMELNVEIKSAGAEIVDRIVLLASEYSAAAQRNIIFSSFKVPTIKYLAQRYPQYRRALLWDKESSVENGESLDPIELMLSCQTEIFHPDALQLTPEMMQEAKARRWLVYPYISLRHEERLMVQLWQRLAELGVGGLCTNFPTKMAAWLKSSAGGAL